MPQQSVGWLLNWECCDRIGLGEGVHRERSINDGMSPLLQLHAVCREYGRLMRCSLAGRPRAAGAPNHFGRRRHMVQGRAHRVLCAWPPAVWEFNAHVTRNAHTVSTMTEFYLMGLFRSVGHPWPCFHHGKNDTVF